MSGIQTDIITYSAKRAGGRSAPHPEGFYRRFNRRLDQMVVPGAVNEDLIADLGGQLDAEGNRQSDLYWLLAARLAEMTLLLAGHYADCGEIGGAGDLLVNPRRVLVYLRGAPGPVLKERHRPLSDQFNPGSLSLPEFAAWFRDNAMSRITEPALLTAFLTRLTRSGRVAATYLEAFQARMSRVADVMRFGFRANDLQTGRPYSLQCRFDAGDYRRLGRHVTRACCDPAFYSPYLVPPVHRENTSRPAADPSGRPTLRAVT